MKIVHIVHSYFDNHSYQENELPEAHVKLGHEVTIISTKEFSNSSDFASSQPRIMERFYHINGCKIIKLPLKFKLNYRFTFHKCLYATLIEESPDLIFFHEIPYFDLIDIIRYKNNNNKCKLFIDYHCDSNNSGKNFFSRFFLHRLFYRLITTLTDSYVDLRYVITPGTADFIKKMYGLTSEKIKLLPLGGNLDRMNIDNANEIRKIMREKLNIADSEIIIVTAGKLDISKNTHNLIKAFNALKDNKINLLIIGSVEVSYKKQLLEFANNNEKIKFMGYLSPEDIYKHFLASDIACFPGSQSVLWQQAICCGLPLLCKYWPGSEYLDLGGNVHFIVSEEASQIQKEIELVVNNSDIIENMKKVAIEKGSNYFSYIRIAQSVIDDYIRIH